MPGLQARKHAGQLDHSPLNFLLVQRGKSNLQPLGKGGGMAVSTERNYVNVLQRGPLSDRLRREIYPQPSNRLQPGPNLGELQVVSKMLLCRAQQNRVTLFVILRIRRR